MYKILLLLLLSVNLLGQNIIELCQPSITRGYYVMPYDSIQWDISPELELSVDKNYVYVTFNSIGTYIITSTYINGFCSSSDKKIIEVIECKETLIWIPEVFSPNGDGHNDVFKVVALNINYIQIEIYNRWGEILYYSEDLLEGWDGFYLNRLSPSGVYNVITTYKDKDNRWFRKKTKLILI